ncbi:uncharacterized protein LOC124435831 [Xenia sp. Carnegie-2017]|uniref:uncharacterized protein LOC124435831 n=1 Tax=Xenia sp. Carnegie-2017 TaxID=2897299 RepID=UPI001F03899D|nr:uncharacterized protein LOC124435831 [Xenia sp. Carnegie-2017]
MAQENDVMAVNRTDHEINLLLNDLENMPDHMKIFCSSLASLFNETKVSSITGGNNGVPDVVGMFDIAEKFKDIREETTKDAIVYLRANLPIVKEFLLSVRDCLEHYKFLSFENWHTILSHLRSEIEKNEALAQTILKMHEDILITLNKRKQKADAVLFELKELNKEYDEKMRKLNEDFRKKSNLATIMTFVPILNLIAPRIFANKAKKSFAGAVAAIKNREVNQEAASIVQDNLIPALSNFIKGLEKIAGFFSNP